MKLTDLKPRWTGYGNATESQQIINGVTFLCPHCGLQAGQRLGVLFHPPIDKAGWIEKGVTIFHSAVEWTRTGDTFETLTLSPSINTAENKMEFLNHWHGHITNGEVT
jgi:hypothetical protein